jgi:hypothetical protein
MILEYIEGDSFFTWYITPFDKKRLNASFTECECDRLNRGPTLVERCAALRDVAHLMRSFEECHVVQLTSQLQLHDPQQHLFRFALEYRSMVIYILIIYYCEMVASL